MPFRDPSYFTSLFVKNLETTSRDELSYWRLLVTYTVQKAFPVHMPTWRLIPVPARNYGMFRAKSSTTTMKRGHWYPHPLRNSSKIKVFLTLSCPSYWIITLKKSRKIHFGPGYS